MCVPSFGASSKRSEDLARGRRAIYTKALRGVRVCQSAQRRYDAHYQATTARMAFAIRRMTSSPIRDSTQ